MISPASRSTLNRRALREWYLRNRNRTFALLNIPRSEAYFDRPIPLRLPVAFYDGHIPAFSFQKLVREALGAPAIDAALEELFERGIDPDRADDATATRAAVQWPSRPQITRFAQACDSAVLTALAGAELADDANPLLAGAAAVYTILEHEEMHHETLLYMLHRLPLGRKHVAGRAGIYREQQPVNTGRVVIPAGTATLGARRDELRFGWDNEFEQQTVDVPAFEVNVNDVTNREYLEFVDDGGPVPPFWVPNGGEFRLLGMFEEMPLPMTWPVYVTKAQADAFCTWRGAGARLMSEAEYHRAAFGTPEGDERPYPWGEEPPTSAHGNFDFWRFDPEPVGISPQGASAWGVLDLIGNGWEWTSTEFRPLPGFEPMPTYPRYSTDFFDERHFVVKGASPVTSRNLVRRSFRNWYRPEYPYVYATFRCAY
ncbi:MAG TPA: SUMF1/EgtB/PvdO family nonheme iron enzyme [Candidatus Acidoferrales bacterium]|nr:SUMF1/EgtB/PvdO family nonheme iron enzyme [Candidatus Acidoferrales bacterium]